MRQFCLAAIFLGLISCAHAQTLVEMARRQVGVTTSYDATYRKIRYPGGDVPINTGVCADVVVRAFRGVGIDLQQKVHEDMQKNFTAYPHKWGLRQPDSNIDHRRVPNLMTYFRRKGWELPTSKDAADYQAGDIVVWNLAGGGNELGHIGIVSDRKSAAGVPLIIHNIGRGAQEEDILFGYEIVGHYRSKA